tara:strand:+ start:494 stop:1057 length:564 start_codon:yes stop_codon:yes gene_type:complete
MLNKNKIIELIISIESIIISAMIPLYISIPSYKNIIKIVDIPISFQVPIIIFLTLIFTKEIVILAHTIYILIGLFILPVFYDGGSLGYLLTPNFGYLLGIFPLIKIINKLNNEKLISLSKYFIISIIALISMHIVGIFYYTILLTIFDKFELISYNIGKYSISKIPYEVISLFIILFILKPFRKLKL